MLLISEAVALLCMVKYMALLCDPCHLGWPVGQVGLGKRSRKNKVKL